MRRTYFQKKRWTVEQEDWLIEHKDIRGKMLMYETFCKAFPDATFTPEAISSKRTELGAYSNVRDRCINAKPLYSERVKKGYVIIKVSRCEWWSKAKWVWVSTHPGEPFDIHNQFMFLDGDNRNFSPDNIMKIDHRVSGVLNRTCGGLIKGQPDLNKARILEIMLKLAYLDRAEKAGLTSDYGVGRQLKEDRNRLARERRKRMTPEQKAKRRAYANSYYAEKRNDLEWKKKKAAYNREWARKHRKAKTQRGIQNEI